MEKGSLCRLFPQTGWRLSEVSVWKKSLTNTSMWWIWCAKDIDLFAFTENDKKSNATTAYKAWNSVMLMSNFVDVINATEITSWHQIWAIMICWFIWHVFQNFRAEDVVTMTSTTSPGEQSDGTFVFSNTIQIWCKWRPPPKTEVFPIWQQTNRHWRATIWWERRNIVQEVDRSLAKGNIYEWVRLLIYN